MKRCIVFGNCQKEIVTKYLLSSKTFMSCYEIINVPPVHLCSRDGLNEDEINKCDLFIYQKVSEAYCKYLSTNYILGCLRDSCKTVSIPNTYFTGYHPQFVHNPVFRPDPKYNGSSEFPYGDINIINLLNKGKGKNEIIEILSDPYFYSEDFLKENLNKTLQNLALAETGLDVKATDFIRDNYRDEYLFYTVNHPVYPVTRHVTMAVLKKIGIAETEISDVIVDVFRGHLHIPIYPSVIKNLKLTFVSFNHRYSFYSDFDNTYLTLKEYTSKYIDYAMG